MTYTTPLRNTEYLTCLACFGDLMNEVEIGDRAVIQVICMFHDQAGDNCWNHENDSQDPESRKYVHQFLTSNGEWDTVTNDDGTPSTFDTHAEAEADMQVFHAEVAGAVERGDMDDHNTADWRVAELEG